jgi:hypothetical protein
MYIAHAMLAAMALLFLPLATPSGARATPGQGIDVTGEWAATVSAPRGALEYTMYLKQEGPRVTGYFQSEFGEIPLRGTIRDDALALSWTMPDAKEPIDVTMTGTVKGDSISGEATLAKVGKGSFRAERTAS